MSIIELNQEQQLAVHHVEGPVLVLAGAGSGKTRIVTSRIAHLLQLGVPSQEILAMTFTNKAADEMRSRIFHLAQQSVLTCTFHSLCARILRESISFLGFKRDFTIYDEEDSEKALKHCFQLLNRKEEKAEMRSLRSQISQAKNALLSPEHFAQEDPDFQEVYALYQQTLKNYNAVDFDDLLFLTVRLFHAHPDVLASYQNRWRFLLIDEYQDTNAAQYTLTQLLAAQHQNVFAVGDPDQSIYSWRGANIHNILNFERDFPGAKVIALEQNYRSRSNILEAANALIQHNASRYEKNLWSDRGPGEKIGIYCGDNEHKEAEFVVKQLYKLYTEKGIPLKECCIFYRTNFQSRLFEDQLLKQRIPYVIVGGLSFYQRREIKDLLGFLRIIHSGDDYVAFLRTIHLPKRGLGESTLTKLHELATSRAWSILETVEQILEGRVAFKLSQKQSEGLKEYFQNVRRLRHKAAESLPLAELLSETIEAFGYLKYLREDPESYEERRENVEELIAKAAEWEAETETPTLSAFLEELALKSSADLSEAPQDQVRMMTLHNGKGLEFTAVFLVGMEEELLPHANALGEAEAIEEERRLCYVGMTRAKEFLYLTQAKSRYLWGMPKLMRPSRFLKEIPKEYLHAYSPQPMQTAPVRFIDEESEEGVFALGAKVTHRDFGTGVIQKSYNTSLGLTYDVFFPEMNATRSLVAKYAKLMPCL